MRVGSGPFREEAQGNSDLLIWMEYDSENNRFQGSVQLGIMCHIEAYQYSTQNGAWQVNDERANQFLGEMCEGNRPNTFIVKGFEGEWITVTSPFT